MPVATKKLRSNRAWIERHINDPFVKRSKAEVYLDAREIKPGKKSQRAK